MDFARMLIMQVGSGHEMNYSNLNATLSKIDPLINISNQALSEYFYKKSSVEFVKSIYENVFLFQKEKLLQNYGKNLDQKTLAFFNRILIQDSTICVLNKKLESKYKGSGGSASKASLKIDVIHELKSSAILRMIISEGNLPDISFASFILEEVSAGDLVLRDLGYFKLNELKKISDQNAYFISRFKSDISVYLTREDTKPIDLGRYLKTSTDKSENPIVDVVVYLGAIKQESRLIAYKVPPETSNERRRKAKRTAACSKFGISEGRLNLCDYVILITNIPVEMLQAEIIGTIYRIRWAIELIFKTWKSHLNLQLSLKGSKATRIECFVYATLIICLLTTLVHGWLKRIIDPLGNEISLDKLTKWLVSKQGYFRLFYGAISKLEDELQRNLRQIRMQKRKRKTTLERVVSSEPYSEKYVANF